MAQKIVKMAAEVRENSGKGVARKLRVAGQIPAVLYGKGEKPLKLAVNAHNVLLAMQAGGFYTHPHTLDLGGKETKVLARTAQRHPVTEKVEHIDFMYYVADSVITVTVPVRIEGEDASPGLKIGGVLQLVRAELELICRSDSIPQEIIVNIENLDIGHSLHMSEVTLPKGVKPSVERDFTIASIVSTRSSTMETLEGAEEGAEGETGTEKKES